eukprot:comp21331_c0_seq1/m.29227 comp21331_c0_seq1/g.29227  ORF comp21331_c0_seq1/g.29227 comp21331_c0_seq1/m.29227 type:complete len:406 (-) comp21331_c0_seq1:58-1275(-)
MALLKSVLAASVVISTLFVACSEATTHNTHRKEHVTIHCPPRFHNACPEGYRCNPETIICEKQALARSGPHHFNLPHLSGARAHHSVSSSHVQPHPTPRNFVVSPAAPHQTPAHSHVHTPSHVQIASKPTETPKPMARAMHLQASGEASISSPVHNNAANPILPKAADIDEIIAHSPSSDSTTIPTSTAATHKKEPAATPTAEIVGSGTSHTVAISPKSDELEATPITTTSGLPPLTLGLIIGAGVLVAIAIFVVIFMCVRREYGKNNKGKGKVETYSYYDQDNTVVPAPVFNLDKLNGAQLGRKQSVKKGDSANRHAMHIADKDPEFPTWNTSASSSSSNSPIPETRDYIVKSSGQYVQVQVAPTSGPVAPPMRPPKNPKTVASYAWDPNSAEYAQECAASATV